MLLHEVHAHGEQSHAEDAVGDGEHHLHGGDRVVLEAVERLDRSVVAEADGGQGDEAEVGGSGGRPALPGGEEDRADEDEAEDEHEVDHDGDHHQVGRHVPLLADLVEPDPTRSDHFFWSR